LEIADHDGNGLTVSRVKASHAMLSRRVGPDISETKAAVGQQAASPIVGAI